ncbi:hypothetical protein ACW5CM_07330 [Microbacterium sp. A588]
MKTALLTTTTTPLERTVLLDMAVAVNDDALVYSWGHDRLAQAIGKAPGSTAAKQALSVRILPSLIAKGLISVKSAAHRGHRAEYELLVLQQPEMGNGSRGGARPPMSRVTHDEAEMGNGSESKRVTVPEGMGNAHRYPSTYSLPITPTSRAQRDASRADDADDVVSAIESGDTFNVGGMGNRRSDAQVSLLSDLHIFATRRVPGRRTVEQFHAFTNDDFTAAKSEYWRRIEDHGRGPAYDGPEPGDPAYEHLSARGRRWADVGLLPGEMSA